MSKLPTVENTFFPANTTPPPPPPHPHPPHCTIWLTRLTTLLLSLSDWTKCLRFCIVGLNEFRTDPRAQRSGSPTMGLTMSSWHFSNVSLTALPVSPSLPKTLSRSFKVHWTTAVFSPRVSLRPSVDRWTDVLGFVPAASVSRDSILPIFRDGYHLCYLLWPPD